MWDNRWKEISGFVSVRNNKFNDSIREKNLDASIYIYFAIVEHILVRMGFDTRILWLKNNLCTFASSDKLNLFIRGLWNMALSKILFLVYR